MAALSGLQEDLQVAVGPLPEGALAALPSLRVEGVSRGHDEAIPFVIIVEHQIALGNPSRAPCTTMVDHLSTEKETTNAILTPDLHQ